MVTLTASEYELVCLLSVNAGRVTTHDSLLRQLWSGRKSGGDMRAVRAFVKRVRRKLGDDATRDRRREPESRRGPRAHRRGRRRERDARGRRDRAPWAAHWDDLELARRLLSAGADVEAAEDHGVTALARAVEKTSLAMVETLIAAGADVNAAHVSGLVPLMTAAETPTWSGRSSHTGRSQAPPRSAGVSAGIRPTASSASRNQTWPRTAADGVHRENLTPGCCGARRIPKVPPFERKRRDPGCPESVSAASTCRR